jgi:pimeloyl-ACP methyl ester carboxylesterase
VLVYGHSAGSALALHAAAAGLNVAKLVLADPPFGRHSDADEAARTRQAEQAATIQAFHDRGDHRGAAAFFLGGFGLPPQVVDDMLDSPAGESMIDSARALPYDYALVGDGLVPTDLAATAPVTTLILAAEAAPGTAQALAESPNAAGLHTRPPSRRNRRSGYALLQRHDRSRLQGGPAIMNPTEPQDAREPGAADRATSLPNGQPRSTAWTC